MGLVDWIADRLLELRRRRVSVHLRIHRAAFVGRPASDAWFLNIWNASPERSVQVTHVWIESSAGHIPALAKPLPAVIDPDRQWETWIEVARVPDRDVFHAGRAQLADGTVISSGPRDDVPPAGMVPG
jgi:hypothetical protein